jgi:hypothetical protein
MGVLRAAALALERAPIACVHDAVFFRSRLGVERIERIEHAMRQATGNPYWRLSASQLFRWERPSKDDESELAAHRARIAAEEARAVGYKRKYF